MKKLLILIAILTSGIVSARTVTDSINLATITGTDTVIIISKSFLNFGSTFGLEIEYTDLSHDDATFDIGTRLEIATGGVADSTFNSYGDILGSSLPLTLDATTNADSYYSKASHLWERTNKLIGKVILFKVTKGSVTSGYIRYTIVW